MEPYKSGIAYGQKGNVMKVVRTLKRIEMLKAAYLRARAYADRHPDTDIDFMLADVLQKAKDDFAFWYKGPGNVAYARRRMVRLARRLLNIAE